MNTDREVPIMKQREETFWRCIILDIAVACAVGIITAWRIAFKQTIEAYRAFELIVTSPPPRGIYGRMSSSPPEWWSFHPVEIQTPALWGILAAVVTFGIALLVSRAYVQHKYPRHS